MPIYEFACQDCGHEFEKIQSFSDSSTPACPNCQGMHVQRRLSAPAIHFKGSGWYITDSKNAAKGSAKGPAKGSATGSSSGGEDSKSESKEEAKSESKVESSETKAAASKTEGGKSESSPSPAAAKAE